MSIFHNVKLDTLSIQDFQCTSLVMLSTISVWRCFINIYLDIKKRTLLNQFLVSIYDLLMLLLILHIYFHNKQMFMIKLRKEMLPSIHDLFDKWLVKIHFYVIFIFIHIKSLQHFENKLVLGVVVSCQTNYDTNH